MKYYVERETKEHSVYPYVSKPGNYIVVEADEDGWVQWNSFVCPVPKNDEVEIRMNGNTLKVIASNFNWTYCYYCPLIENITSVKVNENDKDWTGVGYPPVGTECWCREISTVGMPWTKVQVTAYGDQNVLVHPENCDEFDIRIDDVEFKPINKEDDAVEEVKAAWRTQKDYTVEGIVKCMLELGYHK